MSDLEKLASQMRADWDRRISHDYRFWMSDGHLDDRQMWETGRRDFEIISAGLGSCAEMVGLELGCGVGRLLRPASEVFQSVHGFDVSREGIEKARELLSDRANVNLHLGDGFTLSPVQTESVDFAYSFAALTSMPTDVISSYVLELNRVVRSGREVRLQVYLGREQEVREDDTLHLRCFDQDKFQAAMEAAGFVVRAVEELVLPFQVSFREMGIIAYIVRLERKERSTAAPSDISQILLPTGELGETRELSGRELETWMAANYAKELAERGEFERAKETLEYVATFSETAAIDVRDLLDRVISEIEKGSSSGSTQGNDLYQSNLAALSKRFPKVAQALKLLDEEPGSEIEIVETEEGPAIMVEHQALDHIRKPLSAGEKWANSVLSDSSVRSSERVLIFGFSCGYHIESLLKLSEKQIAVFEPDISVLRAAMQQRDFRELLERIDALEFEPESLEPAWLRDYELVLRPQAQAVYPEIAAALQRRSFGERGLTQLQPQIAVLGPLHGGTLPIAGYTQRTLELLNQRSRDINVSGFDSSYQLMEQFLRDDYRKTVMRGNLTELVSQILLENIEERPIDVLICMAQAPITARALTELRNRGVVTVMWFVEDYLRFRYWEQMAPYFDFMFTIQQGPAIEAIERAGAGHVSYLPCACEPSIHAPIAITEEERRRFGSKVSFVGAGYHNRQQSFASLANYDFKIWGTEWPECKPFDAMVQEDGRRVSPADYVKVFCASDINLNLHSSKERDGVDPTGDFVNPRTFELASANAFQLVDHRSLLPDLFTPGEELVTFSSISEMREQIDHFVQNPDDREKYRAAARRRALSEHTYQHRLKEMLSRIYSVRFDHLKRRQDASPWAKLLGRSKKHPELYERCQRAFERGEEANLDGLISDIITGEGELTETEQKLLFLHHIRSQIIRMEAGRQGK